MCVQSRQKPEVDRWLGLSLFASYQVSYCLSFRVPDKENARASQRVQLYCQYLHEHTKPGLALSLIPPSNESTSICLLKNPSENQDGKANTSTHMHTKTQTRTDTHTRTQKRASKTNSLLVEDTVLQ